MSPEESDVVLPNTVHTRNTDMAIVDVEVNVKTTPPLLVRRRISTKSPAEMVKEARAAFKSGKTKDVTFRETQLKNFMRFYDENQQDIFDALAKDLRKHPFESYSYEIGFAKNDLINLLMNFKEWVKPEQQEIEVKYLLEQLMIYNDPHGVVLVIGAWNYPIQLTLLPVAGAIAAGNCVVIKPPEIATHVSKLIAETIPKYLDRECYQVFEGGVSETTDLLKQRFDYIFFTGSPMVGKIIHQAAAKFLTPTTLELGGKSPCYIDPTSNVEMATKRILWGKLVNGGQTCIAPDYVLCTEEVETSFIRHSKKILKDFYGSDIKKSPDLCRIVSQRHFDRLVNFLKTNKVAVGGNYDAKELYIEPTILVNVNPNDLVMQEEIFGPILPIVQIESVHEAIQFINEGEKPLALYIFCSNDKTTEHILRNTTAGGVTVNDTLMHITVESLPFGGVGNSGMGSYHGKKSFDLFVHKKSVLKKPASTLLEPLHYMRYPPYSEKKLKMMNMYLKKRRGVPSKYFKYFIVFMFGMMVAYGMSYCMSDD